MGGVMAAVTGGNIIQGIALGALGGALTGGISSSLFSICPSMAATTGGKALVYSIAAFASSAVIGAVQGVHGSQLWRGAAISAGIAFATTMVLGSISDAAKNYKQSQDYYNVRLKDVNISDYLSKEYALDGKLMDMYAENVKLVDSYVDSAPNVVSPVNQGGSSVAPNKVNLSFMQKVNRAVTIGYIKSEIFVHKFFRSVTSPIRLISEAYGGMTSPTSAGLTMVTGNPEAAVVIEQSISILDEVLEQSLKNWEYLEGKWIQYGQ